MIPMNIGGPLGSEARAALTGDAPSRVTALSQLWVPAFPLMEIGCLAPGLFWGPGLAPPPTPPSAGRGAACVVPKLIWIFRLTLSLVPALFS